MVILYSIGAFALSCLLQFILSKKTRYKWIEYLFIGLIIIGLVFSSLVYLNIFWPNSPSVIAENQSFAQFLILLLVASLLGCLFSIYFQNLHNQ